MGIPARFVMQGRPRNHFNSWIVSAVNGLPTGYDDPDLMHPQLQERPHVINTQQALLAWLNNPN